MTIVQVQVEKCVDETGFRSDKVINRETSPFSSEKSDLVKIGSDRTSCHTSG